MKKKKEIFIALNNFETPNPLAIYGAHLAKQLDRFAFLFGVTKIPLHTPPVIITDAHLGNTVASEMNDLKIDAERNLQLVTLDAEKIYPHVYYDTGVGFNESAILSKTEKEDPYLVILEGTNELTNLHEWFGTYETRLAEDTEVPALVVPESYNWKPIRKILYVMDLDDQKVENMRYLTDLAKALNAHMAVVTISDSSINDNDERYVRVTNVLRELLGYTDIPFHRIFANDPSNTISKLMEESNIDVLAFEHKSRSFLERIFGDYNTKHLILQTDKPVLVF